MKESSWEGIQEMYEKGEISEEQMNNFIAIRNLSYKEWKQVKKDYLAGTISKEQYEQLKQIKEMPDDWTTMENGIKGILYGAGSGVWEGLQWYVGGKISTMAVSSSNIANSAARISADTIMNSADTPYRTILDSLISGDSLKDTWDEKGGWKSLFINAGIGLIGSAGSEVAGNVKAAKNIAKQERIDEEINKLIDVINTGESSDEAMVNFIQNSFEKWLKNDNPYAEKLLNKIIEIKQNIPEYRWRKIKSNDAYNNFEDKELVMGEPHLSIDDVHTYAHETGHQLFSYIGEQFPDNWDEIITKARTLATNKNSEKLKKLTKQLEKDINISYKVTENEYMNYIKSKGYDVPEQYIDSYAKDIEKYIIDNNITIEDYLKIRGYQETYITELIEDGITYKDIARMETDEVILNNYIDDLTKEVEDYMVDKGCTVEKYLEEIGLDEDEIEKCMEADTITYREIAIIKYSNEINTMEDMFYRKHYGEKADISDIIASVFRDTEFEIDGEYFCVGYGHDYNYYNSCINNDIHELIANFTALKMNGNKKELKQIKEIFGKEFYSMLDNLFEKIIN